MTQHELDTTVRRFTHASLLELLRSESNRSRSNTESLYDLTPCPLPTLFLYFVGAATADATRDSDNLRCTVHQSLVVGDTQLVERFLDENGNHPWWINLSPFAVTSDATVFHVAYSNDYTDRIFVGPAACPGEPFHLLGPTLPASWRDGDPIPPITLPFLHTRDD